MDDTTEFILGSDRSESEPDDDSDLDINDYVDQEFEHDIDEEVVTNQMQKDIYANIIEDKKGIPKEILLKMTKAELEKLYITEEDDIQEAVNNAKIEYNEIIEEKKADIASLRDKGLIKEAEKAESELVLFRTYKTEEELSLIEDQLKKYTSKTTKFVPVTRKTRKARIRRDYYKSRVQPIEAEFLVLETTDPTESKKRIETDLIESKLRIKWKELYDNEMELQTIFNEFKKSGKNRKINDNEYITSADFKRVKTFMSPEKIVSLCRLITRKKELEEQEDQDQVYCKKFSAICYYISVNPNVPLTNIFHIVPEEVLMSVVVNYIPMMDLENVVVATEDNYRLMDIDLVYNFVRELNSRDRLIELIKETSFIRRYNNEVEAYNAETTRKPLEKNIFHSKIMKRMWVYIHDQENNTLFGEAIYNYFRELTSRKYNVALPHNIVLKKVATDIDIIKKLLTNRKPSTLSVREFFKETIQKELKGELFPAMVTTKRKELLFPTLIANNIQFDVNESLVSLALKVRKCPINSFADETIREYKYYNDLLISLEPHEETFKLPWEIYPHDSSMWTNMVYDAREQFDTIVNQRKIPVNFAIDCTIPTKILGLVDLLETIVIRDVQVYQGLSEMDIDVIRRFRERQETEVTNFINKTYERLEKRRIRLLEYANKCKIPMKRWYLEKIDKEEYKRERLRYGNWKYNVFLSFFQFYMYQHFPKGNTLVGKIRTTNSLELFIATYMNTPLEVVLYNTLALLDKEFLRVPLNDKSFRDIALSVISLLEPFVNDMNLSLKLNADEKFILNVFDESLREIENDTLEGILKVILNRLTDQTIDFVSTIPEDIIDRLAFISIRLIQKKIQDNAEAYSLNPKMKIGVLMSFSNINMSQQSRQDMKNLLTEMFIIRKAVVETSKVEPNYEEVYDILADRIINSKPTRLPLGQWFENKEATRAKIIDRQRRNILLASAMPIKITGEGRSPVTIYHKTDIVFPKIHKPSDTDVVYPIMDTVNIVHPKSKLVYPYQEPKRRRMTIPVIPKTHKRTYIEIDAHEFLGIPRRQSVPAKIPRIEPIEITPREINIPVFIPKPFPIEETKEYEDMMKEYNREYDKTINVESSYYKILESLENKCTSRVVIENEKEVEELVSRIIDNEEQTSMFYLVYNNYLPLTWFKEYMSNPKNLSSLYLFDRIEKISPEIWITDNSKQTYEDIRKYMKQNRNLIGTNQMPFWKCKKLYTPLTLVSKIPMIKNIAIRVVGNNIVFLNKSKEFWANTVYRVLLNEIFNEQMKFKFESCMIDIENPYVIKSSRVMKVYPLKVEVCKSTVIPGSCIHVCHEGDNSYLTLSDGSLIHMKTSDNALRTLGDTNSVISYHHYKDFEYFIKYDTTHTGMVACGYMVFLKGKEYKLQLKNTDITSSILQKDDNETVKDCYTDNHFLYLRVSKHKLDNRYIIFDTEGKLIRVQLGFYSSFEGRVYLYNERVHYFECISREPGDYQYKGYFEFTPTSVFIRFDSSKFHNVTFNSMYNGIINGTCNQIAENSISVSKDSHSEVLFIYGTTNVVMSRSLGVYGIDVFTNGN